MHLKLLPGRILAISAILLTILSGCSQYYTRFANPIPATVAAGSEGTLSRYATVPRVDSSQLRRAPRSAYVRFVIDELCVRELPGLFDPDADNMWIGVSTVAGYRGGGAPPLFEVFRQMTRQSPDESAEARRMQRRQFALDYRALQPYSLPTNAESCIPGAMLAPSMPVPIDGGTDRTPAALFVANALFYEEARDARRRFTAASSSVRDLVGLAGGDISQYVATLDTTANAVEALLSLVRPEQYFLWAELAVPVAPTDDDPQTVLVPSPEARFAWLFTDPNRVEIGSLQPAGEAPLPCVRRQQRMADMLAARRVALGLTGVVVNPRNEAESCAGSVDQAEPFGNPYLIWHVEVVDSIETSNEFWSTASLVANVAADGSQYPGGGWSEAFDTLAETTTSPASARLLSQAQRNLLVSTATALERAVSALGLRPGVSYDVCEALVGVDQILERSARTIPVEARTQFVRLQGRLQQTANSGGLPCQQARWYPDRDGDAYGDASSAPTFASAAPTGFVTGQGDCYDSNADAHPNQMGWFGVQRGDGSFDYNCDGAQTREITTVSAGCYRESSTFGLGNCLGHHGWIGTAPDCGRFGRWLDDCDTEGLSCSHQEFHDRGPQRCQ